MRILGTLITTVTASVTALTLGATPALASVTFDAGTGKGFVGKGDVQTVLGYNNAALQKAVDSKSLVFTATQPTSQQLSQAVDQVGSQVGSQAGVQAGSQNGTQSASQVVSQVLVCDQVVGGGRNRQTFHRDGVRDGSRTGTRAGSRDGSRDGTRDATRTGTRTGTRAGTLSGSLTYDIDVDARRSNQYTGFLLNGWKGSPAYTPGNSTWDAPQFGDWSFGDWTYADWSFTGAYTFGEYTFGDYTFASLDSVQWGAWDDPSDANVCLSGSPNVTIVSNVTAEGAVTDGAIVDGPVTDGAVTPGGTTDGAITEGEVTDGAVTAGEVLASGPAQLLVNGKAL